MQNILFIVNDSPYSGEKNLQRCSFRHQHERRAQQECKYQIILLF